MIAVGVDSADGERRRELRRHLSELRALLLTGFDTLVLPLLRIRVGQPNGSKPSVAVFNLHGAGDLLLSLPCLEQIRRRYPTEQYSLILYCQPSAAELAKRYAPVDRTVVIDRHRMVRSFFYRLATLRDVAARCHAVTVQPTYNRMLAVEDSLVRASGAGERLGSAGSPAFGGPIARRIGDRWYHRLAQASARQMHELDRDAEFLQAMGWPASVQRLPSLAVPEGPPAIRGSYVLLVPDSSSPLKSWPMERFEALAHQIAGLSQETIVFAGTHGANGPKQGFRQWRQDRFVDLSGQTSMDEFLRLIKGASLVITNDSAGLHLGVMLGRPVVAIAGGGLPQRYHPYPAWANVALTIVERRLPCYGCNWNCIYPIEPGSPAYCIANIDVSHVMAAIGQSSGGGPH
jgi:ADP-heptose:LPS heptosyltransferase